MSLKSILDKYLSEKKQGKFGILSRTPEGYQFLHSNGKKWTDDKEVAMGFNTMRQATMFLGDMNIDPPKNGKLPGVGRIDGV